MRDLARRRLPKMIFDFIDGGAETEATVRANRAALDRLALRPKVLVDVADRDLTTSVCGLPLSMPLILGPTGLARLAHPDGELAIGRAAQSQHIPFVLSTGSSFSIEDVAAATGDDRQLWFQLYLLKDRKLNENLLERAKKGAYEAVVVTVDVPVVAARERDLRNGMTVPPHIGPRNALDAARRIRWTAGFLRSGRKLSMGNLIEALGPEAKNVKTAAQWFHDLTTPKFDWSELQWVRSVWDGPLMVKGILRPDDARRAVDSGADAIVVSNHGGRQLDFAPPTIDVLPGVVDAVGSSVDVLMDGGIRRGSDIVKAVALGAKACLMGRPYLYGLGAGGQAGVESVITMLRSELSRCLALLGCSAARDLSRDFVQLDGIPAPANRARVT
jgi:L-lactate dehydrogenase (cytochrome)